MTKVNPSVVIETPSLLWGTQTLFIEKPCRSRNTPTNLENTIHHQCRRTNPHTYEEHYMTINKRSKKLRITPTPVGKTDLMLKDHLALEDHPHTREKYLMAKVDYSIVIESPPPMWGTLVDVTRNMSNERITPTPVGNILHKSCQFSILFFQLHQIYSLSKWKISFNFYYSTFKQFWRQ